MMEECGRGRIFLAASCLPIANVTDDAPRFLITLHTRHIFISVVITATRIFGGGFLRWTTLIKMTFVAACNVVVVIRLRRPFSDLMTIVAVAAVGVAILISLVIGSEMYAMHLAPLVVHVVKLWVGFYVQCVQMID